MTKILATLVTFVFLLLLLLGGAVPSEARGGHGGGWGGHISGGHAFVGRFWGHPSRGWPYSYSWPYYHSSPYYSYGYAPSVIGREEPPVFIQPAPVYRYYCEDGKGYYTYVQQCPKGWVTVVPPAGGGR